MSRPSPAAKFRSPYGQESGNRDSLSRSGRAPRATILSVRITRSAPLRPPPSSQATIHGRRISTRSGSQRAIAEASNAGISLMNMLQLTLAKVGEGSGSAAGFAYLSEADETASRLSAVAVWHSPERGGGRAGAQISEPSLIIGLVERVFKSGAPDWIADLLDDAMASSASTQREGRVRAALAFPVRIGREVAAVLAFLTDRSVEPDPGLLRLMAVVSAHVARVIERQRAHHDLLEAHARPLRSGAGRADCARIPGYDPQTNTHGFTRR